MTSHPAGRRRTDPRQAAIAAATHQAVAEQLGDGGYLRCEAYAHVGAVLATDTYGRSHRLAVGAARVHTTGRHTVFFDPAVNGYHAWIADDTTGTVADLSLRHMRTFACRWDAPWQRDPLPPWYWGSRDGLAALGVILHEDPGLRFEPRTAYTYGPIVVRARQILAGTAPTRRMRRRERRRA